MEYHKKFHVLQDDDMGSDHIPITAEYNTIGEENNINNVDLENANKYNFNKANWSRYAECLQETNSKGIYDVNELNNLIPLTNSRNQNIPLYKYYSKNERKIIPEYILDLITHKKAIKAKMRNINTTQEEKNDYKKQFNYFSTIIK